MEGITLRVIPSSTCSGTPCNADPSSARFRTKEALKGVDYDVLTVCGFALDAHAGETAAEFTPERGDVVRSREPLRQFDRESIRS